MLDRQTKSNTQINQVTIKLCCNIKKKVNIILEHILVDFFVLTISLKIAKLSSSPNLTKLDWVGLILAEFVQHTVVKMIK